MKTPSATTFALAALAVALFLGHCSPTGILWGSAEANRSATRERRECEQSSESAGPSTVRDLDLRDIDASVRAAAR